MKNKRIVSLVAALVLILSTVSSVFAESWDLKNTVENKLYPMLDWFDDSMIALDVAENPENYIIEVEGKFYNVAEILELYEQDPELSIEGAVAQLIPVDGLTIVSAEIIEPIEVAFGTSVEEIGLPEMITLNLSNETTAEVAVKGWSNNYNANIAGEYAFTASYELPENVYGEKPEVIVTVKVLEKVVTNVEEVEALIEALPAVEEVTIEDAAAVGEAKDAFDVLTAEEQAEVKNADKLEALLEALQALENKEVAQIVIDMIEALDSASKTYADDVAAARVTYDELSEDQKALVTNLEKLEEAEASLLVPDIKVAEVSAINDTTIVVTFDKDVQLTEEALIDTTIVLTAGEVSLTAKYVAKSLKDGKANFALAGEDKLVDATTYAVSSEDFAVNLELLAKVADKYPKTFAKVTTEVIKGDKATIYVSAKDQYGDNFDLSADEKTTVKATLNGMPLGESATYSKGIVTINNTLLEGDELVITLTSNKVDSVLSYTVIKGEVSVVTTVAVKAEKESIAFGDTTKVTFTARDQYNNPIVIKAGEVNWFVGEDKQLATGAEFTFNKDVYKEQGSFVVKAFYAADTKKNASVTITVGDVELKTLTFATENPATTYNNEEIIVGKVTANEGAILTPEMIKLEIKAETEGATLENINAIVKLRGGKDEAKAKDIIVVATTSKAGKYTITPYVENGEKPVKANGLSLTTTINPTVAKIDPITIDAKDLKVGNTIKADLVFRNKHNEIVVLSDVKDTAVEIAPSGLKGAVKYSPKTEKEAAKNYLELDATLAKADEYLVVVKYKDVISTRLTVGLVKSVVTTINAGADVTGVVAGDGVDKAVYSEIKFLDQDSVEMSVANKDLTVTVKDREGKEVEKALITLGKSVTRDEKTKAITGIEVAGADDAVVAYKVLPAEDLAEGTYTVEFAVGEEGKEVIATVNVTVGAARVLKEIKADKTAVALTVGSSAVVKVTPVDQYGEFKELDSTEITTVVPAGIATIELKLVEDEDGNKHYNAKITGAKVGEAKVTLKVTVGEGEDAVDVTKDINVSVKTATELINAVAITNKAELKPLYKGGAEVELKAEATDVEGNVIPTALTWTAKSFLYVDGKLATEGTSLFIENGKVTLPSEGKGKVVVTVETVNLKTAQAEINFDNADSEYQVGTLALKLVEDKENVFVTDSYDLELTKETERLTFVGKDQYGAYIPAPITRVTSDNVPVVRVAGEVELTAVSNGTAVVYVRVGEETFVLNVTVAQDLAVLLAVKEVANAETVELDKQTITATFTDGSVNLEEAYDIASIMTALSNQGLEVSSITIGDYTGTDIAEIQDAIATLAKVDSYDLVTIGHLDEASITAIINGVEYTFTLVVEA